MVNKVGWTVGPEFHTPKRLMLRRHREWALIMVPYIPSKYTTRGYATHAKVSSFTRCVVSLATIPE